jgi:hypothetical protein
MLGFTLGFILGGVLGFFACVLMVIGDDDRRDR